MDRSKALEIVASTLEGAGQLEALAEVRRWHDAAVSTENRAGRGDTLREITRALLENEKSYRLVFSHEVDPMSLFEPTTGQIIDVNDSWLRLYGYTREEALAMKVQDVSAEPAATKEAMRSLGPGATTRIDVRWHRSKDGTVFPVELTAGSIRLGERQLTYAVMRDITQRERAERALERSEASFRGLIESMPDAVIVHRHGACVYMSPSARRLLGYGDEDIRGMPLFDIVHPDDRAQVFERVKSVLAGGGPQPLVEERILRRDGTSFVAEIVNMPTVFDGEPAILALGRDVTMRKEMEAQLVMNDRLASLGRLAASVGHELNNPLAYVLGIIGLMERDLEREDLPKELGERFTKHVAIVKEGAHRMRTIVQDLRTLGRGDDDRHGAVDLQHVLDVCVNMAEHELRDRARVVKHYADRAYVVGTEARLGQVFLNLLVNASQAIEAGHRDDNEVTVSVRTEDGRVIVDVADTGAGIAPEHLDRVFEPFFTTKGGRGTGLGLPISHRIVASLGGSITVEPRTPRGTSFRVVLPAAEATLRTTTSSS